MLKVRLLGNNPTTSVAPQVFKNKSPPTAHFPGNINTQVTIDGEKIAQQKTLQHDSWRSFYQVKKNGRQNPRTVQVSLQRASKIGSHSRVFLSLQGLWLPRQSRGRTTASQPRNAPHRIRNVPRMTSTRCRQRSTFTALSYRLSCQRTVVLFAGIHIFPSRFCIRLQNVFQNFRIFNTMYP